MTRVEPTDDGRPLDQIAVALDTPDFVEFSEWCEFFGPRVGVLKVGLQAFVQWGAAAVEQAAGYSAGVFLDLKLHDIPATVAGAAASASALGVSWLTVHASGGPRMLTAAAEAVGDRTRVLAVTVLTSIDDVEARTLKWPGPIEDRVATWAALAEESGCAGVVASPQETSRLRRERGANFALVTPGIRPAGAERADQSRVATPAEALRAGADLLVIGRPLTRADDPEAALARLATELSTVSP